MADLVGVQRRIGHAGDGVGLENDGAVLAHDKIAARNAQTAEGLVGRAGKFLGTRIVFGRNLRRNTVNIRRVDVLYVKVVELAVFGLTNLNDRQRAHIVLAVHADGDLSASMHFSTSTLSPYSKALAMAAGSSEGS